MLKSISYNDEIKNVVKIFRKKTNIIIMWHLSLAWIYFFGHFGCIKIWNDDNGLTIFLNERNGSTSWNFSVLEIWVPYLLYFIKSLWTFYSNFVYFCELFWNDKKLYWNIWDLFLVFVICRNKFGRLENICVLMMETIEKKNFKWRTFMMSFVQEKGPEWRYCKIKLRHLCKEKAWSKYSVNKHFVYKLSLLWYWLFIVYFVIMLAFILIVNFSTMDKCMFVKLHAH